jgi:hypothetical protein
MELGKIIFVSVEKYVDSSYSFCYNVRKHSCLRKTKMAKEFTGLDDNTIIGSVIKNKNEKAGKIPKTWNGLENNIELNKFDYFPKAIELLNQEYIKFIDTRYNSGKSIKFIDLEAVRMGICTEDLAMFLALHVEPNVKSAKPLLKHYYNCLCETVKDYSYDNFMNDYKISVMENMFFPIKLMNRGIYDFNMRDRAIKAFETMIL